MKEAERILEVSLRINNPKNIRALLLLAFVAEAQGDDQRYNKYRRIAKSQFESILQSSDSMKDSSKELSGVMFLSALLERYLQR